MRRLARAQAEEETDIDITPMLDVVFIMLIFFIVTASFIKESGIGINKPESNSAEPPQTDIKPIVVEVNDLNEIHIQKRIVDPRAVKPTITRLRAESPESSVIVKVDKKSKTKTVIQAIDGIRDAGISAPSVSVSED